MRSFSSGIYHFVCLTLCLRDYYFHREFIVWLCIFDKQTGLSLQANACDLSDHAKTHLDFGRQRYNSRLKINACKFSCRFDVFQTLREYKEKNVSFCCEPRFRSCNLLIKNHKQTDTLRKVITFQTLFYLSS